jgi:HK97 family phage portal protein
MPLNFWPFSLGRKEVTVLDLPAEILQLGVSKSGKGVTVSNALKVATVLACVRVISEGVAQVPCKLLQSTGRSRIEAREHPLWDILHRKPNDVTTSFGFRETLTVHAALTGNGYAFISRGFGGKILELINIEPSAVTVNRADRMGAPPTYTVSGKNGSKQTFPAESILHIQGPSWDGIVGMEVVKLAREAIGLTMATEEAHARLHSNGAKPGGLLSVDGTLKPEQFSALRKWIDDNYTGSDNAWKTMILDRSAKFVQTAMTGVDAQHIETRRFQIEEVCRIFRVMPIMVCSQDKSSTYAGAEQNFLAHVVHTLQPWYERIEQAIDCQLLTAAERAAGYYTKLEESGLLRGALKDTAEYLYKLAGLGILTRNEAREMLDRNPLADLDEPLTPINLTYGLDAGKVQDQTAKALADLSAKLDALASKTPASQPLHVSFNQEPLEIRNEFAAPAEQKAAEPVVIQNVINIPESPAPIVKNDIHVPPATPSPITLEATITPEITLSTTLPARKTHTENVIERDGKGNIIRSFSDSIESDV